MMKDREIAKANEPQNPHAQSQTVIQNSGYHKMFSSDREEYCPVKPQCCALIAPCLPKSSIIKLDKLQFSSIHQSNLKYFLPPSNHINPAIHQAINEAKDMRNLQERRANAKPYQM
jgi:hypothetical protein